MQSAIVSSQLGILTKAAVGMFAAFTLAMGAENFFSAEYREETRILLNARRAIKDIAADIQYFNLQTSHAIAGDDAALMRLHALSPVIEREVAETIENYQSVLGPTTPDNLNTLIRDLKTLKSSVEQALASPLDGTSREARLNSLVADPEVVIRQSFSVFDGIERAVVDQEARVLDASEPRRIARSALTWVPALLTMLGLLLITKRVRLSLESNERSLTEYGHRFRDFARASSDIFWETGPDGTLQWSEGLLDVSETISARELVGRKAAEILTLYGVDDKRIASRISTSVAVGEAFRGLTFATTLNGVKKWRRISGVPIFDETQTYKGMRGVLSDVTQEMEEHRARRELLARSRAAAISAHENMFVVDNDGLIESVDGPDAEIIEKVLAEAPDRSIASYLKSVESDPVGRPRLVEYIEKGLILKDQVARVRSRKSGQLEYFRISGAPIIAPDGRRTGYVFVAQNINREHLAEAERKRATEIAVRVLSSVSAIAYRWVGTIDGVVFEYMSDSSRDVLGVSPEQFVGSSSKQYRVAAEDRRRLTDAVKAAIDGPGTYEIKIRLNRADGSVFWALDRGTIVERRPDGTVVVEGMVWDIDSRERAEQALVENVRMMNSIVENARVGFYSFTLRQDGQYRINLSSPGLWSILGIAPRETGLIAEPDAGLPQEFLTQVRDLDAAGRAGMANFDVVRKLRNPDGSLAWIRSRGKFTRLPDGSLLKEGVAFDITEQMAQREEIERLKAAIDRAGDAILILDTPSERISYANVSAHRLLKRAMTHSANETTLAVRELFSVEDRERWSNAMALVSNGRPAEFEVAACRDDGVATLAVAASPLQDGGCLLVLRDISQIREIERVRKREVEATARLMSNLPGAVFRTVQSPSGSRIYFQNQAIEDLSGYSRGELEESVNDPGLTLIHGNDRSMRDTAIADALADARNCQVAWRLIHRDGSERWVLERSTPRRLPNGVIEVEGLLVDISAQMETEQMLRAQREQYAEVVTALDKSNDAVMITTLKAGISYCNPAFANLVKLPSPRAALGRDTWELFTADDPAFNHRKMQEALDERGQYSTAHSVKIHDGTKRVFAYSVTQLDTRQQVVVIRDVSDETEARVRKDRMSAATARLAQSEEIAAGAVIQAFQLLCREARTGLGVDRIGWWRIDQDAGLLKNEMLWDGTGEPARADYALPLADIEPFLESLRGRGAVSASDVLVHEATKCFAEKYLAPIGVKSKLAMPIYGRGRIAGVFCAESTTLRKWTDDEIMFARVVCDVAAHAVESSERRTAQEQLSAMTSDMSEITRALDLAHERILVESAGGGITFVNTSAAGDLANGDAAALQGKSLTAVFERAVVADPAVQGAMRYAVDELGFWSGQIPVVRREDGATRIMRGKLWRAQNGGRVAMWSDVTDEANQMRRENELRARLAQAKKMEALGALAGGIAHDFNNIIGAIQAFAQILGIKLKAEENRKYASRISRACDRAAELVRQVMAFSQAGTAEREPTAIHQHLEDVFSMVRGRISANVELAVDLESGNPIVEVNAAQVDQLMLNLCVNAADAIGPGAEGHILVTTRRRRPTSDDIAALTGLVINEPPTSQIGETSRYRYGVGALSVDREYLVVSVGDNGPGMVRSVLERIFEPFFSTKPKGRGTGLGLAVSASVVSAHAGAIVVTTGPGQGSEFDVFLPLAERLGSPAALAPAAAVDAAAIKSAARVMIVDDEVDLADAMAEALAERGFSTQAIYDSALALETFREDPGAWDAVLTDQIMPKVDGISLIRKLKRIRPDIPVVLYSGFSEGDIEKKARQVGAAAFFRKPVGPEVIARCIAMLPGADMGTPKIDTDVGETAA